MIRDLVAAGLMVPLVVVALLGGVLGFEVTREVGTPPRPTAERLSVVSLPTTPAPTPSPTPAVAGSESGSSGGGGGSSEGSGCPAGCRCAGQPRGIVIICH